MSNLTTESTFVQDMEKRVVRLQREFEQLDIRAESASRDIKRRYEELRAGFEKRRGELKDRMERARQAGESAGSEVQEGIEAAWNDLSDAFNRARNQLVDM